MNKYQEALDRIKSIDLDIVLDKLGYDVACDVSVYGIHDYPLLEMDGDIKTLQQAVDMANIYAEKRTPKDIVVEEFRTFYHYLCPNCNLFLGLQMKDGSYYKLERKNFCPNCAQGLSYKKVKVIF